MEIYFVSENLVEDAKNPNLEIITELAPLNFDENGNLI